MAAVAEKQQNFEFADPQAIAVTEMAVDQVARLRAHRLIGSLALGSHDLVEVCTVESPIESLHDAINRAEAGDIQARRLVETNVRTDVIERTIKTGHVMNKVPLTILPDGTIMQYGQGLQTIQANSLRHASGHPAMRARTEAETRNAFRIEQLYKQGAFENYSFVVISRAADDMSLADMKQVGFFTDTMSCSIQVTGKFGAGLATETAFVSGITEPGKPRSDAETASRLGQRLGVNYNHKSATEIIDTPMMVPNHLIANGVIDMVAMWDAVAGTFFGENKPAQDYLEYLESCAQREQSYEPKVQQITSELIESATVIDSAVSAVELLSSLSEHHMVTQAIIDNSIDLRVFGLAAMSDMQQARLALERGDGHALDVYRAAAEKKADTSSCPGGGKDSIKESSKASDQDCEFVSKECPKCHAKNVKTTVRAIGPKHKRISGSCHCTVVARISD
ncbi:MAG: hypothetical protein ABIV43_01650 [Candidatus Saccharimonadales bacterium]